MPERWNDEDGNHEMSQSILCKLIGDLRGELSIDIEGYERESGASDSDANWLTTTITLSKDNFCATAPAALTTQDLGQLAQSVGALLRQETLVADFASQEDALFLRFRMSVSGAGELASELRDGRNAGALQVRFAITIPELARFEAQLEMAMKAFPVRAE